MSNRKLARRYVVAVGELAQESHMLEQLTQELVFVGELASRSAQFQYSISQTNGSKDLQERVLRQLVEGHVHQLTLCFLLLLVQKRRLVYLPDIVAQMQTYTDEVNSVQPVQVTTAVPLSAAQQGQVGEQLGQMLGHQVRLQCVMNPDLLGGMIIQVGDKAFDGSIAGRLRYLLRELNPLYRDQMMVNLNQVQSQPDDKVAEQIVAVTTAVPLEADLGEGLKRQLEQKLGTPIQLVVKVQPEVLGGMIIQMGDQVLDGSIAGRLRRLLQEINPQSQDQISLDLTQLQPRPDEAVARQIVSVTTAVSLEADLREALRMQLEQKLGNNIELVFKVQPEILGGVKVQAGAQIYDDSMLSRLARVFDEMNGFSE